MNLDDNIPSYFTNTDFDPFAIDYSNNGKRQTLQLRNKDNTLTTFIAVR